MSVKKMKDSLKNLDKIDPEFADFLKKEDGGLLDFDVSDYEEESDDDEEKAKLEIASDQEDSEDMVIDDQNQTKRKKLSTFSTITLNMIDKWSNMLQDQMHLALSEVSEGLRASIEFNTPNKNKNDSLASKYVIDNIKVYNSILNLCIVELVPALYNYLNINKVPESHSTSNINYDLTNINKKNKIESSKTKKNKNKKQNENNLQLKQLQNQDNINEEYRVEKLFLPTKSKFWKKIKGSFKKYAENLINLLEVVKTGEVFLQLLKHTYSMIDFFVCFPKLTKILIKKIIDFWSSSENEVIRLTSLRCLIRSFGGLDEKLIKFLYSNMYMSCLKNCRFTNQQTLPFIHFMIHSLVQVLTLHPKQAYLCAFFFIQQLAKYLNNAIKSNKQDAKQSISNWQFCHSLTIWSHFLSLAKDHKYSKTLIHPLIEIIMATIRFNLSTLHIPLRFHCSRCLIHLTENTGFFIPVLSIITEPLNMPILEKQPKQKNMKNCILICCLKMNKNEIFEKVFLDAVVEEIVSLTLQFCLIYSSSISFPELVLPTIIQLKKFIKTSKSQNYVKKIKQLLEKLEKRSEKVSSLRIKSPIDLKDEKSINFFEESMKKEPNELEKMYMELEKQRINQIQLILSKKDQICKDDIPKIEAPMKRPIATDQDRKEFNKLFRVNNEEEENSDDDDDDDNDDEERFKLKNERKKKENKIKENDSHKAVTSEIRKESTSKIKNQKNDFEKEDLKEDIDDQLDVVKDFDPEKDYDDDNEDDNL